MRRVRNIRKVDFNKLVNISTLDTGFKYELYLHSSNEDKKTSNLLIDIVVGDKLASIEVNRKKEFENILDIGIPNIELLELFEIGKFIIENYDILIDHWDGKLTDREVREKIFAQ